MGHHPPGRSGLTIEQQIQAEIGQQAADQVSISNSIGSLRFLGTMDWQEFVETMSPVEQSLRLDPAGTYGRMDFATRDNYRHVIEKLAKRCTSTEVEVAEQALALAREPRDLSSGGLDERTRHVGYYLVGRGLALLEKRLCASAGIKEMVNATARAAPLSTYLGAITIFTMLFAATAVMRALGEDLEPWLVAVAGVLAAIGSSQLALALVNSMATQLTRPHPLARMDYQDGIPTDARTLVVVPTLIVQPRQRRRTVRGARSALPGQPRSQPALLPADRFRRRPAKPCLATSSSSNMRASIAALNLKYACDYTIDVPNDDGTTLKACVRVEPFLLLHRPRLWSAGERAWIGFERKRGKLSDLNAFLRGGARERFSLVEGAPMAWPACAM
jgi:cyclic beta-1,2-glucan synthetase